MIKPISFSDLNNRYGLKNAKTETKSSAFQTESLNLSNYQIGKAIFARNNISFRSLSQPIEITDKYNKPTNGKDHLDLPNIHVYEYPDTNLQVFVNEVENITDKNKFQASLSLFNQGITNDSVMKKNLLMELINKSFNKDNMDVNLNEDYDTFININLSINTSEIDKINRLNKIINKPNFSKEDLEECKKNLINKIKSPKYQKETSEFKMLIDNSLLNSKEETIKNIQNITLNDINSYYSEILRNTEAQYTITIDKSFVNDNKNSFYSILNSDISNKFQKHSDKTIQTLEPTSNKKNIRIYDNNNKSFLTFHYPQKVETNRDRLISKYLTLLEFLWRDPYVSENFSCEKYSFPMELKSAGISPNKCGFLEFNFTPLGNENITSTEQAIEVFKAILEILYDEELSSNTLESIKDFEKELYDERLNKTFDSDNTHQILQMYRGDIFKLYETIDDINIEDIRKVIEKVLFEQNPIVIINEKINPYKDWNQ